jgi:hypothetical protein
MESGKPVVSTITPWSDKEVELRIQLCQLAENHQAYGCPQVVALLQWEGYW